MAVEAADVTLFTNDLGCLEAIIRLGVRVRRTILQNVGLAVGTKVSLKWHMSDVYELFMS